MTANKIMTTLGNPARKHTPQLYPHWSHAYLRNNTITKTQTGNGTEQIISPQGLN